MPSRISSYLHRHKSIRGKVLEYYVELGAKETLGDLNLPIFSHLPSGLSPGVIIELCGGNGTAKSELLHNVTAHCILSQSWNGAPLSGRNVEVVYISTDYKFDVLRLVTILEGRIVQACNLGQLGEASSCPAGYKELIQSCLSRAHILYCKSSTELLATLHSLKTFVSNHPEVCVLILDNIASFYWTDRCESSRTGLSSGADTRQQQWVGAFKELVLEHHLVAFAAKPHIFGRSSTQRTRKEWPRSERKQPNDPDILSCDEFMSRHWQRVVKYRFHLQKSHESVPRTSFPAASSSSQALDHARMFGTFTAQQVHPVGPVYRFVVLQHGVEFITS